MRTRATVEGLGFERAVDAIDIFVGIWILLLAQGFEEMGTCDTVSIRADAHRGERLDRRV